MGWTVPRLAWLAASGLALLHGAACTEPPGARFSPASGVLTIHGTGAADLIIVSAEAGAIVVNEGAMAIAGGVPTLANTVRIEVRGREGADYIEIDSSGPALPEARLVGGPGADLLLGGAGDDVAEGGPGDDVAVLGDGDDVFVWRPGDGIDTVEGEDGSDALAFYGSEVVEALTVAPVSGRLRVYRDVDAIELDLGSVEEVDLLPGGGGDAVYLYELSQATRIGVDLSGFPGTGDGSADGVYVRGTQDHDVLEIAGDAAGIAITGLSATVEVRAGEAADRVTLDLLAGHDASFSETMAGAIPMTVNGGLGNDLLLGGAADELFNGGDGDDSVRMGGGDDVLVWNPGDDNDTVDGEVGYDTLRFHGTNVAENIDVSRVGDRVRFFRNVAGVTAELDGVEAIEYLARGGSDFVLVNDLSGTDLVELLVDLAGAVGGGDGAVDHVALVGAETDDFVQVFGDASDLAVVGLAAQITVVGADGPSDALSIYTAGGDDVVQASGMTAPAPTLTADGGEGHDALVGSDGADVLYGGEGDDVLVGGPGLDVLDGGPGDNVLIQ